MKDIFLDILSQSSISLSNEKIDKLLEFLKIFLEWNDKINLSGLKSEKEILEKHFLDSIFLSSYLKEGNAIDIGTGGGFPGIVLAISNPNIDFTLVDSIAKKTKFLEHVKESLKLRNVRVINSRAESLEEDEREKYNYAFARAVAKLNVILEYVIPFLKVDGEFLSQKSISFEEEIKESFNALKLLNAKIIDIKSFTLPISNQQRVLIFIKKLKESSKLFPRKEGLPSKKPL